MYLRRRTYETLPPNLFAHLEGQGATKGVVWRQHLTPVEYWARLQTLSSNKPNSGGFRPYSCHGKSEIRLPEPLSP